LIGVDKGVLGSGRVEMGSVGLGRVG